MKKTVLSFLLLITVITIHAQRNPCENFNSNTVTSTFSTNTSCTPSIILGNWYARQASLKYENYASQGGTSDVYLKVSDVASGSCSSWIYNNTDYHGDWSNVNDCFCYDFRFFSDGGIPTAPTLLQIYSGGSDPFSATYVAEFVLNTPITIADGWKKICPPIMTTASSLPANIDGHWEMRKPLGGSAADWNSLISSVSGVAFKVDINAGTELYGLDNICIQDCPQGQEPYQSESFCCPGTNLVINPSFENGNTGFSSQYVYNATVSNSSTMPGQYNIVTGQDAASISSGWVVQDANTCSNTSGKFMVVNGSTCGTGKKVIWEQTLTVKDWTSYKFCASAKNLNQCNFNVKPNLEVQFSMAGIGNITQTLNVSPGACDWFIFEKNIDLWGYGTSLTIKILLDESVIGDGNDLALDNIALIEIPKCPLADVTFQVVTQGVNATDYQISATSSTSADCNAIYWEVCEYDINNNSCVSGTMVTAIPAWWFANTNFPTYNSGTPGIFKYGKFYKITRGTWGKCNGWASFDRYIGSSAKTKKIQVFTAEDLKKNKQQIINSIK